MNSKQFLKKASILIVSVALTAACAPAQHTLDAPKTSNFTPGANITAANVSTPAGLRDERVVIPTPSPVVETKQGRVVGLIDRGVSAYKGLRYAAPPIGQRRFRPPAPLEPWQGIYDATAVGAPAMQLRAPQMENDRWVALSTALPTPSESKIDNEDCLFLNVWTPAPDTEKRPVLVWLHGGGFTTGSGSWPMYDGRNLARRGDVVVVTLNHRLNAFGYLYLAEIGGDEYSESGNVGMLDLIAALEWTRDNIAAFGGDPSNVTIMGESGGGYKVSTLMAMPDAKGLFHKAVIQSGPALKSNTTAESTELARAILGELGIADDELSRLELLPADTILDALATAAAKQPNPNPRDPGFAPVVDGTLLPRHPFAPNAPEGSVDVPLLIGWNKDEWTLLNIDAPWFGRLTQDELAQRAEDMFGEHASALVEAYSRAHPDYSPSYVLSGLTGDQIMFTRSVTLAERKAAQDQAPVYMYHLTWETPVSGGVLKSPHTLEIPLVFDNVSLTAALTGDSPEAYAMAAKMSDAWIAFARTGNPNTPELPEWPPYNETERATMVFDLEPVVANDPKEEIRLLMPPLP